MDTVDLVVLLMVLGMFIAGVVFALKVVREVKTVSSFKIDVNHNYPAQPVCTPVPMSDDDYAALNKDTTGGFDVAIAGLNSLMMGEVQDDGNI